MGCSLVSSGVTGSRMDQLCEVFGGLVAALDDAQQPAECSPLAAAGPFEQLSAGGGHGFIRQPGWQSSQRPVDGLDDGLG